MDWQSISTRLCTEEQEHAAGCTNELCQLVKQLTEQVAARVLVLGGESSSFTPSTETQRHGNETTRPSAQSNRLPQVSEPADHVISAPHPQLYQPEWEILQATQNFWYDLSQILSYALEAGVQAPFRSVADWTTEWTFDFLYFALVFTIACSILHFLLSWPIPSMSEESIFLSARPASITGYLHYWCTDGIAWIFIFYCA